MSKLITISKSYTAPGQTYSASGGSAESVSSGDDLQQVTNRGSVTSKKCTFGGVEAKDELKIPVKTPEESTLTEDSVALYFEGPLPIGLQRPQSLDLAEMYLMTISDPVLVFNPQNGVLLVTDILSTSSANYITIDITGYGKVDAGPFRWLGQAYLTSGGFADATIRSTAYGEVMDVRIFVQDGLVKLWFTGRTKSIANFSKILANISFGTEVHNRVIDIQDTVAQTLGVTSEKYFKNFSEQYIRPLSSTEQNRLDKSLTSAAGMPLMQVWKGTLADYQSLTPQENTVYMIVNA
ncbi:MAG: hypothetical protein CVU12_02070 [Bacteroidetes bacterium HGW-Bacteroidetes-7]|jgi:hypothetical protein|nr:MAG: hypothetical protein CVU12_02070 [Bacteroidetes bacterium HGW-Bacteroidetes-7]